MIETLAPGVRKYAQKFDTLKEVNPRVALTTFFVLGLALRLFFLKYRFAVSFDEVNYLKLGVSGHLHGLSDVLHTYWSPLLPAFISFMCNFFEDYELAARLVSVLAGAFLPVPVFFLTAKIYDRKAAVLAAGFVALFPPLAFQSTLVLTEPLVMCFGTLAVLFGLLMLQQYAIGYALLAGFAAGLAYLGHPMAFGFLVVLTVWLLLGSFFILFLINKLRLVYLLAALAIGFMVVASPYLFYLKQATGSWTISAKGAANQQMETPLKGEGSSFRSLDSTNETVPIDRVFHQGTFLNAAEGGAKPVRQVRLKPFLTKYVKNFANMLQHAIPTVLTLLPALLLGIGLLAGGWQVQCGKQILFLSSFLVFYWLILIPAFHINLRYLTPMLPFSAVFVGAGAVYVYDQLRNYMPLTKFAARRKMKASSLAAALCVFVFLALLVLPEFGRVISRKKVTTEYVADPVEQKVAGLWLLENTSVKPIIMSRNHAVDFYAGNYNITQSVTIPTNSYERVLAYARHRNVTHIELNERYLKDYPALGFLLEGNGSNDDLQQIYRFVDEAGFVTVIYRLL